MPNTQSDALSRAIEALGAVEVAPGKWAYHSAGTWYIVERTALVLMGRWLQRHPGGKGWRPHHGFETPRPYSSVPMPSWWTPQQRFAWRYRCSAKSAYHYSEACPVMVNGKRVRAERITASLQTGEEVPA